MALQLKSDVGFMEQIQNNEIIFGVEKNFGLQPLQYKTFNARHFLQFL